MSGPVGGRVVVASEPAPGEGGSVIRIVDAMTGCASEIGLGDRIARRVVADPGANGVLAHLLEPGSRRDLGVWRIGPDGRIAERLLEPVPDALLAGAGIDRVWATDLRLDADGRRLAVQSCHPNACVMRVVDLSTGAIDVLADEHQGPIIGFSGRAVVTWAACHGLPCPVVEWDGSGGSGRTLALDASGAALSGNGRRLVVVRGTELVAVDVSSGASRTLGPVDPDAVLLSGTAGGMAAMEVAGADVAIGHAERGRAPETLTEIAAFLLPDREVQP